MKSVRETQSPIKELKEIEMQVSLTIDRLNFLQKKSSSPQLSRSPQLKKLIAKRKELEGDLERQRTESILLQRSASCPPSVENTNLNPQANESESKRPMSALSILLKASENAAAKLPKTQTDLVAHETNALNDIERLGKSLSTHATSLAETAPPVSSFSPYDRFSGVANTFFGQPSFLEKIIDEQARKESNVPWHAMKVAQEREKQSSFSELEDNDSKDGDYDSCSSSLTNRS